MQFAGIESLADCTAGPLYSRTLQSPKDIGMRSEGGYDMVPLDQSQRDDIDISNGYHMHARFDQSLTAGSFQGLLQRRGVGSSYMLNPTEHNGHGFGTYDRRQHVSGDHELNLVIAFCCVRAINLQDELRSIGSMCFRR